MSDEDQDGQGQQSEAPEQGSPKEAQTEERSIRESIERSVTHINPDPETKPPLSNLDSVDTSGRETESGSGQSNSSSADD